MIIHRNTVPPQSEKNSFCAIDVELFGADKKKLHRPTTGKFALVTFCLEPGTVYTIEEEELVQEALDAVDKSVWVFHNAQFDIRHLRRWATISKRSRLWDTMTIEKILFSGYYDDFALDDLVRRYLHEVLDKSLQKEWENATEITKPLLEYAVKDAHYTLEVVKEQKKCVDKKDWRIWKEVDGPVMWAVLDMKGFPINVEQWKMLADKNRKRQEEIDEQLPMNPRSHVQVKKWFASKGKKLPSTGKEVLEKLLFQKTVTKEMKDVAQQILDSRMYGKRASTYGHKFLDEHLEYTDDGVAIIHSNYWITGTETGRFSSSNPNMQNIPARTTLEFRECFVPYPDHVLVVADFSSQEPRVIAYKTRDEHLQSMFTSGKDVYIAIAYQRYREWIEKSDKRRSQMKDIFLGLGYGLTPKGLSTKKKIPLKEATDLFKWMGKEFPVADRYMKSISQQAEDYKISYVETVMGRKCHLNPYVFQRMNNARNAPIQGSAADMMKLAMVKLHEYCLDNSLEYPVVAVVHDEMVLSVPKKDAQMWAKLASDVMSNVGEEMCPGIPFVAESIICENSWAEAK